MRNDVIDEFENVKISRIPIKEALRKIEEFHGGIAPGIVLGGLMIDLAQELIGEGVLYNVVAESRYCLPDAVQIFTPCTVGNNWLAVKDYGRYAVTLYNIEDRVGVRVWVDMGKLERYPEIWNWFLKRVPKKELPLEVLLPAMLRAGRGMLSALRVKVADNLGPGKKGIVAVCPICGECYPEHDGDRCVACREGAYYEGDAAPEAILW